MKNNIDEIIECVIREKGLLEDMKEIDRRLRKKKRNHLRTIIFSAAACLIVLIGVNIRLHSIATRVGYSFTPTFTQRGNSEITALIQEKRLDEALAKISSSLVEVNAKAAENGISDPDYIAQLTADRQELAILEASCRLRKGQYLKSRRILKGLVNAGGAWSDDAKILLEKL